MSFELQKWERGMSSMPSSGSRQLAGVPGVSRGVLASLGTSLPQPLPKVCAVIFGHGTEAMSLWKDLEEPPLQHQAVQTFGDPYLCPDMPQKLLLLLPVLW